MSTHRPLSSVYSVNVPVPGRVRRLASELYPTLVGCNVARIREDHSLLLKRLGEADHVHTLQHQAHRALEGAPAVEAAVTGIETFENPPLGPGPVIYLAVESPGLEAIHADLTESFGSVEGLEGADYVPHITLGRGGDRDCLTALTERPVEPITWTISELEFFDGEYRLPVSRISLPA